LPTPVRICGCPIDPLTRDEAVGRLVAAVAERWRLRIVFINVAKIVRYRRDPRLRRIIDEADLRLADGKPLVWFAPLCGGRLPERVNGTDLMERMVAESARRGLRVFFLGARPEVLAQAVRRFCARHPRLVVAGTHHGYFDPDAEGAVVSRINAARPDILFLAFGTPAKEYWMDRHRDDLAALVQQPVGGSVDVAAGVTRRAPKWMQNAGLEWFWRILQEPRRMWKRYLVTNTAFLAMLAWSLVTSGFRSLLPRSAPRG